MSEPYKFDDAKREIYLQRIREGMRCGKAAESVNITRQMVWETIRRDPEFAAQVEQAERDACEAVEDALWQQAIGGNMTAIQVWLYNRNRDRWKDQRNLGTPALLERMIGNDAIRDRLRGAIPSGALPGAPDPDGDSGNGNGTVARG